MSYAGKLVLIQKESSDIRLSMGWIKERAGLSSVPVEHLRMGSGLKWNGKEYVPYTFPKSPSLKITTPRVVAGPQG